MNNQRDAVSTDEDFRGVSKAKPKSRRGTTLKSRVHKEGMSTVGGKRRTKKLRGK